MDETVQTPPPKSRKPRRQREADAGGRINDPERTKANILAVAAAEFG
jgi:hypothetical protein